jgi:hypothetical protein
MIFFNFIKKISIFLIKIHFFSFNLRKEKIIQELELIMEFIKNKKK